MSFKGSLRLTITILLAMEGWFLSCSTQKEGKVVDSGTPDSGDTVDEVVFSVDAAISERIGTVGIVEWSANREITGAVIEFGRTTNYGNEAPVDLLDDGFRTLVLGMKPSSEYHFRIRAWDASSTYLSDDYVLETGPVPNALPLAKVEIADELASSGGFITTSSILSGWVYIIDSDGDCVWWYQPKRKESVSRACMSYEADRMLVLYTNNEGGEGTIEQVGMDGTDLGDLEVLDATHDMAPIPGGITAFIEVGDTCGGIVELNPDGTTRLVYDIGEFTDGDCHPNALRYSKAFDSYTVSVFYQNTILKVDRESGQLLWAAGGDNSSFEGTDWIEEHGHQLVEGGLLLFSNGQLQGSRALEYKLDETSGIALLEWEYSSDVISHILGDVQRLPNGNTLVTYSVSGVFHEVSQDGQLVREIELDSSGAVGYATWQESLYATY